VYNSQLYAGTTNTNNDGVQIWRYNGGSSWTDVTASGTTPFTDKNNTHIENMMACRNCYLYVGTHNEIDQSELWRTFTGAIVTASGSAAPDPVEAGQEITFTFDIDNAGPLDATNIDFTNVVPGDILTPEYDIDGGGWNPWPGSNSITISSLASGATTQIQIRGIIDTGYTNPTISTQTDISWDVPDYLFVAIGNHTTGGELWRYDGTSWDQVNTDGFGNPNNVQLDSLASYGFEPLIATSGSIISNVNPQQATTTTTTTSSTTTSTISNVPTLPMTAFGKFTILPLAGLTFLGLGIFSTPPEFLQFSYGELSLMITNLDDRMRKAIKKGYTSFKKEIRWQWKYLKKDRKGKLEARLMKK
jgi:uncharacterized repeat protein (TIGR01451 family)